MSAFVFTELTQSPETMQTESACLGVDADNKLTDNDIGKAVKIAAANNYVLCATTNEIEAILVATEPVTYNDGFAFGTVQRRGRAMATVGANEAGTVDPGDLVVADTQAAIDTAGGLVCMVGSPTTFLWRCIRIVSGTGATGDTVLIERV
jgi:succinyl-CoA synthetase alpha subunit